LWIRVESGTPPRPPTHPHPSQEAGGLAHLEEVSICELARGTVCIGRQPALGGAKGTEQCCTEEHLPNQRRGHALRASVQVRGWPSGAGGKGGLRGCPTARRPAAKCTAAPSLAAVAARALYRPGMPSHLRVFLKQSMAPPASTAHGGLGRQADLRVMARRPASVRRSVPVVSLTIEWVGRRLRLEADLDGVEWVAHRHHGYAACRNHSATVRQPPGWACRQGRQRRRAAGRRSSPTVPAVQSFTNFSRPDGTAGTPTVS
jgi:hypothetical protein